MSASHAVVSRDHNIALPLLESLQAMSPSDALRAKSHAPNHQRDPPAMQPPYSLMAVATSKDAVNLRFGLEPQKQFGDLPIDASNAQTPPRAASATAP
jgi:hypothetical protein